MSARGGGGGVERGALSWIAKREAIQLVSLASVLPKIVRSEENKWNLSAIGVADANGDDENDQMQSPKAEESLEARTAVQTVSDNCIIEHAQIVNQVHKYFRMLDRRRLLLNLGNPRTFNNMRVVQVGGAGDGSEDIRYYEPEKTVILAGEELALYRYVLMCAHYPALCAPSPPSPTYSSLLLPTNAAVTTQQDLSPPTNSSSLPPIVQQGEYVLRQEASYLIPIPNKPIRPPFCIPSPSEGLSHDVPKAFSSSPLHVGTLTQDDCIVNTDVMREYVRHLFQQSTVQQSSHEHDLREMNRRRIPAELLVRELVTQLAIIERNSHSYYRPNAFVTKHAYDQWQQWEKQNIHESIATFWSYTLPHPGHPKRRPDYHAAYKVLLSKIISFETREKRRHPVLKDVAPSRPLSNVASRLLREFGHRYGIGELYRSLAYLNYLAQHFENDVWYVRHTTTILNTVLDLLPTDSSKMIITNDELETLGRSIKQLHGEAEHSLTRIKRLFPENDPPGGLASLIDLLVAVLRAYPYVNKVPQNLSNCLQNYLTDGFDKSYERHKTIAQGEMNLMSVTHSVTPALVNSLIWFVRDEVETYAKYFQETFIEYFNVSELAVLFFYNALVKDVNLMLTSSVDKSSRELDYEMISVAYRLTELDRDWFQWIRLNDQEWRHQFAKQAELWVDILGDHAVKFVIKSVGSDEWRILQLLPNSQRPARSGQTNAAADPSSFTTSPSPLSSHSLPRPIATLSPSRKSAFTPISSSAFRSPFVGERGGGGGGGGGLNSSSCSSNRREEWQQSTSSSIDSIKSRLTQNDQESEQLMASLEDVSEIGLSERFLTRSTNSTTSSLLSASADDGGGGGGTSASSILTFSSSSWSRHQTPKFNRRTLTPQKQKSSLENPIPSSVKFGHQSAIRTVASTSGPSSPPPPPVRNLGIATATDSLSWASESMEVITEGTFSPIHCEMPSKLPFLPISNSIVDLLAILLRLAKATELLTSIVFPVPEGKENPGSLLERMTSAFEGVALLYGDNMLCSDLCGISEATALSLMEKELLERMKKSYSDQLIWGCRHMKPLKRRRFDSLPDCEKLRDSNSAISEFEQVTFEMCVRVNNVAAFLGVLPALYDHLTRIAAAGATTYAAAATGVVKLAPMVIATPPHDSGCPTSPSAPPTSAHDMTTSSQSSRSASSVSVVENPVLSHIASHLAQVQKCQIRLMCFRMNRFLKPCLHALLSLDLPQHLYPLEKRLNPTLQYLTRHLSALADCLYPQCFTPLLQCLWSNLVQTFHEFSDEIVECKEESGVGKAQLALRTIARFIDFFHANGTGLDLDSLVQSASYVLNVLELLVLPSKTLIDIYKRMKFDSSSSSSYQDESKQRQRSTESAVTTRERPLSPLSLADLRENLHNRRKCFTGKELIDQVTNIQQGDREEGYATPPTPDHHTSSLSSSLEICRRLIESKIISPLDGCEEGHFVSDHLYRFCYPYNDSSLGAPLSPSRRTRIATSSIHKDEALAQEIESSLLWKMLQCRSRYDRVAKSFIKTN